MGEGLDPQEGEGGAALIEVKHFIKRLVGIGHRQLLKKQKEKKSKLLPSEET